MTLTSCAWPKHESLSLTLARIDGFSCYISPQWSALGELMTHGGLVGFYCKQNVPHRILDFTLTKDHDIEVLRLWARPKSLPRQVSSLISAAIYFPPRGPYWRQLVEYLQQSCDSIRIKYLYTAMFLCGDFKDLKSNWIKRTTALHQIVKVETRG